MRVAGKLCEDAMNAMVARAKPGVKEYELRAAAGAAILEGGGDIDFLIIGSTPMDNPALIFGNPRPSARELKKGDIINMELAAGYRGYTAQIGSPICVGEPNDMVRNFWEKITLPGYHKIVAEIAPGKPVENMRQASKFFRDNGYQSRPTQVHGIDLVTDKPHVVAEHVSAEEFEQVLKPGMIIMAEPNPISADGLFGIFLGHTFIVTDKGHEVVDKFPLEIAVASGDDGPDDAAPVGQYSALLPPSTPGRGARKPGRSRRLIRRRRLHRRPQVLAPAQRDDDREGEADRGVERRGGGEADALDQRAGDQQADRQAVDRHHAHAHDAAAEALARFAHQDHRQADHGEALEHAGDQQRDDAAGQRLHLREEQAAARARPRPMRSSAAAAARRRRRGS